VSTNGEARIDTEVGRKVPDRLHRAVRGSPWPEAPVQPGRWQRPKRLSRSGVLSRVVVRSALCAARTASVVCTS